MKYISVLVTYNRKEKLIEALNSLLNQTLTPQRIVLIDNHSTDGTRDLLEKEGLLNNQKIDYHYMDKNYGGSGGFYNGVKVAMTYNDFDFLSLSDDDAIYENNYFELIDKYHQQHTDIKAFCGTVKYEDGDIQTDHRRVLINDTWLKEKELPLSSYKKNFYVDTFSFVGCVISSEIIREIGLPDKEYFIYYDDTEYSLRVRKHTQIVNVSAAVIIHKTPKKSVAAQNLINWKNYYEIRNSMLMKEKHSHWKWLKLYFRYHKFHLDLQILFDPKYKGQRRKAFYVYNHGYQDAMAGREGKNSLFLPGVKLPYSK